VGLCGVALSSVANPRPWRGSTNWSMRGARHRAGVARSW